MLPRALALSAGLIATPAAAVTPILTTPAVAKAVRTGEILGGAGACGVPEARVLAVARKVIYRIRDLAPSPNELRQAQAFHEEAVRWAAARIKAGRGNCGESLASFAALEAE